MFAQRELLKLQPIFEGKNNECVKDLSEFVETVIDQGTHHAALSTKLVRLIKSFAQDITSLVTRGKYIQRKHFLLGQSLHKPCWQ